MSINQKLAISYAYQKSKKVQHILTKEPNKQGMPKPTQNFLSEIHELGAEILISKNSDTEI